MTAKCTPDGINKGSPCTNTPAVSYNANFHAICVHVYVDYFNTSLAFCPSSFLIIYAWC